MGATRMNITLPEDVVKILKRKTRSGEKSAYIAQAIRSFAEKDSHDGLIKKMIEGYRATNKLGVEDQVWLDSDLSEDTDEY